LALLDSDEEYESDNYTFSPKAATDWKSKDAAILPAPSNETAIHCDLEREHGFQAFTGLDKVHPNPPPVRSPATGVPIYTSYMSQTKLNEEKHHYERIKEPNCTLGHDSGQRNTAREKVLDGRELCLLNMGGSLELGGMKDPREKFLDLMPSDRPQARMQTRVTKKRPFILSTTDTGDNTSTHHTLEPPNIRDEQSDMRNNVAEAPSGYETGKTSITEEEEIMDFETALNLLNMLPKTTPIQLSATAVTETLAMEMKLNTQTALSLDFEFIAQTILGTGSWVEEDTVALLRLEVEVDFEVYSINNDDLGILNDQLAPTYTTFCGNSTSKSTPQNNAGVNSSDSGSRGAQKSPPNGGERHRKHPSDGGDGAGDDEDPAHPKKVKTFNGTNRRFVCPFYIHDPAYFKTTKVHGQKYTLCAAGQGFADIARLK
jgi:hypothetical protein